MLRVTFPRATPQGGAPEYIALGLFSRAVVSTPQMLYYYYYYYHHYYY